MISIKWIHVCAAGLVISATLNAMAFKESPEGAVDDPAAKQLLIEKEIARDQAQRDFIQKRNAPREETIVMKVRESGSAPGDRGAVIAQKTLSREEYAQGDLVGAYHQLREESGLAAPAAATGTTYRLPESSRIANTLLFAGLAIVGLGWWFFRRYDYTPEG